MRPFRSQLLLRIVATFVVVGVGLTLAPAAVARDAREDALRSLLNDVEAFEMALDAARHAQDADPRAVFVEAYVAATDGEVAVETIEHLLAGASLGLVAPVLPDEAFVPTPPAAPTPPSGSAAVLTLAPRMGVATSPQAVRLDDPIPALRPKGRALQPRAP